MSDVQVWRFQFVYWGIVVDMTIKGKYYSMAYAEAAAKAYQFAKSIRDMESGRGEVHV